MKPKKSSASQSEVVLPKFYRLRLESIECKRNIKTNETKLTASINRSISISLLNKSEKSKNCRVIVNISVTGNWSAPDESDPIISFSAAYNAKFDFPETIDATEADRLLSDNFYRNVLVVQTMPLVNSHMYSQLDMMGIDTHSRSLGMDASGLASRKHVVEKPLKLSS